MNLTPEYIRELADIADPDELWRIASFDHLDLTPEKIKQLDTGIALRRYASHVSSLLGAMEHGKSVLVTQVTKNSFAQKIVNTPIDHEKLRKD